MENTPLYTEVLNAHRYLLSLHPRCVLLHLIRREAVPKFLPFYFTKNCCKLCENITNTTTLSEGCSHVFGLCVFVFLGSRIQTLGCDSPFILKLYCPTVMFTKYLNTACCIEIRFGAWETELIIMECLSHSFMAGQTNLKISFIRQNSQFKFLPLLSKRSQLHTQWDVQSKILQL